MSKRSAQRHRQERRELERRDDKFEQASTAPIAISDETRALDALAEIVERKAGKDESVQPRFSSPTPTFASVFRWALTAMANEPGSRASTRTWDTWYRAYAAKEPFLSGVLNSAVAIDKNRGWTLTGGRNQVNKYTKRLHSADEGAGWRTYIDWQAQSYYTTRDGFVTELGREGRGGPLYKLWSVDPCRVELTGNIKNPLRYYPSRGAMQEWTPDMYLRGKSLVSTDEAALDYGYPAVARCYELAKIMVGVYAHYQQKVGTRTPDGVLTGKFIGEEQWNEAVIARAESLRADPDSYLNSIATIMSSGGDMPEFALTLLSSMPDRWDIDTWTLILMRGYALAFGYQSSEFYPEPAGVMGRGKEQEIQQRSATGKGGKDFALAHQEQIQSVLPPTLEFQYEERDVTGEQADAQLKLAKAQIITEMTKWLVNTQNVLTSEQVLQLAAQEAIIPEDWTPTEEDVTATDEEAPDSERVYRACAAFPDEPIVRYSWPSGKTRILYRYGADRFVPRFVVRKPRHFEHITPTLPAQFIAPLQQPANYPIQERGDILPDIAAAITMAVIQERFDPGQPRDEQGQWTDTGAVNTEKKIAAIKISKLESGREIAKYDNNDVLNGEIYFDLKSAKASVYSAEKMLRPFVDVYGRIPDAPLFNALKIIRTDGNARIYGRKMTSRFSGVDAATGEGFDSGTEIFFINGKAIIENPKSHPEWLK